VVRLPRSPSAQTVKLVDPCREECILDGPGTIPPPLAVWFWGPAPPRGGRVAAFLILPTHTECESYGPERASGPAVVNGWVTNYYNYYYSSFTPRALLFDSNNHSCLFFGPQGSHPPTETTTFWFTETGREQALSPATPEPPQQPTAALPPGRETPVTLFLSWGGGAG
jgi:hypothetical protein